MSHPSTVYLDISTGDADRARGLVRLRYPDCELTELSHRELRDGGWRGQARTFRSLRGHAVIFYFDSFADSKQLEIIPWLGLLHNCRETAIVNRTGEWRVYRRRDRVWMLPTTILGLLADMGVFAFTLAYLKFWRNRDKAIGIRSEARSNVAYLFPFPLNTVVAGGAVSHIRGFLGGIEANRVPCRIFSGTALPTESFPATLIPATRKLSVFWESKMLSYNFRFAGIVQKALAGQLPSLLYQRHGRFCIAGAILAKRLKLPLVLEYNGSEIWMSDYWDPARFRTWLRLCEETVLHSASLIVVVSEPLRDELVARGIPAERVLVNPNAVDPEHFHPLCGGDEIRSQLGLSATKIVVGFVGTFSDWHGVGVLQQSIARILDGDRSPRIKFLLVGHGPLQGQMREFLKTHEASGNVIFTGLISHEKVREYLDAADILVSPHIPMPDGRPFFGSPTKLFEYMAMGKGVVASNLDQLARVLEHNATAWMVEPGDVDQLTEGILRLANQPELRARLGKAGRQAAIERHSWRHNAANVLTYSARQSAPGPGYITTSSVPSGEPKRSTA